MATYPAEICHLADVAWLARAYLGRRTHMMNGEAPTVQRSSAFDPPSVDSVTSHAEPTVVRNATAVGGSWFESTERLMGGAGWRPPNEELSALERQRTASVHLRARLGTRQAGIEASRARIVAASDEARRRLERDLHDGAQQRFVFASLVLKRASAPVRGTAAEPLIAEALEQIQQGLVELRELAYGIHPALLRERGLAAALQGLAARSPLPVELRLTRERAAPALETAIYFTIAEALTNTAKHAQATSVRVTVEVADGVLVAEIADDGMGGASTTAGAGLRGLADRLDALGGKLTVHSPRGGGTRVRAQAPCAISSPAPQGVANVP
jgi:signal transduction histidine kinase